MSTNNDARIKELLVSMLALVEKLTQSAGDAGSLTSLRAQLQQKFTAVQALASTGREEKLARLNTKFEAALGRVGGCNNRDAMDEFVTVLVGLIEDLRKAMLRSGSGARLTIGPSPTTSRAVGSPSPPSAESPPPGKLLGVAGLRGRSSSLHLPKKMIATKSASPINSPPNSPPFSWTPGTVVSPKLSAGVLSPRSRPVTVPRSLRWNIGTDLKIPSGMSPAEVEMTLTMFFDGVSDLLTEMSVSAPSVPPSKHATPFQKSPRSIKAPTRKQESIIANLFGAIESVLRVNTWSDVFHARLEMTQRLVSGQALDRITEMCSLVTLRGVSETFSESTLKLAGSLRWFLETYKLDVDSAVVGIELHS
jgi:hypothetical protein